MQTEQPNQMKIIQQMHQSNEGDILTDQQVGTNVQYKRLPEPNVQMKERTESATVLLAMIPWCPLLGPRTMRLQYNCMCRSLSV